MSQGGTVDETGFFGLAVALRAFLAGPLRGDPSGRALARAAGSPRTRSGTGWPVTGSLRMRTNSWL